MSPLDAPPSSRLLARDVVAVGFVGLRSRRLRAALSALGIAIGIASMVAVLGISASSQADLLDKIDRLGTNLLTVRPGQTVFGQQAALPQTAQARIASTPGVTATATTYVVAGATARRNALVDADNGSGIAVTATDDRLPGTLRATLAAGSFPTAALARYPTVVLGAVAARRLGIPDLDARPQIYIAEQYFTVVGILDEVPLDASIDRAALIGLPVARRLFEIDRNPSKIYLRADDVVALRNLVARTTDPENPIQANVSRPSDALAARAAAQSAFTSLLVGLGAVALLVGGVGIANVMVISVLERRAEIGLRRALGATRRHITAQFLTESLLLATTGGIAGAALGAAVTAAYATARDQPAVVPLPVLAGGVAAAVTIGAVAGLYPSLRAARLSPTEALRSV